MTTASASSIRTDALPIPEGAKHTPGPWHIEPQGPGARGYWIEEQPGSAKFIAMSGRQESRQREVANARLIAASPDLLDALQGLYDLCTLGASEDAFRNGVTDSSGAIDEGDVRASDRIDAARAAIRLAQTGER